MKKIFIYTAILATVATACSKLENEPLQKDVDPDSDVVMITEKVSANVNPSSKADIDADAKFTWSAGDQLAVHVSDGNYYTTEALASGGSKSATFSVTYPDGQSRDAFAIYPASIVASDAANYGQSGTSLNVTLPSSYTLDQVSGTATPCPMIATNSPGNGWEFKQLCGLLRLTVKGIPSDAVGIIIQFPGNKVNGPFSITSPVSIDSPISTDDPATGQDKITITFDAGITEATVNIPLPTGIYEDVYIIPFGSSTKVAAVRHIKAGGYTAAKAHARKLTTTMVAFSLSASKKVVFAPGNLQATTTNCGTTWSFSFAPHQYDFVGNAPANNQFWNGGNQSVKTNGIIDLFSYSTTDNYFGIGDRNITSNSSFRDWGINNIGKYETNFWRTPTEAEWQYVVGEDDSHSGNYRQSASLVAEVHNALCTKATINDVRGFILFPDNFNYDDGIPVSGVSWVPRFIGYTDMGSPSAQAGWSAATISSGAWDALEERGCVFLPLAGSRIEGFFRFFDPGFADTDNPGGFYMSNNVEL